MKPGMMLTISLLFALFCIMPAAGVITYLGGSPQLSVAISGTNEYIMGQDVTIPVVVQNSGISDFKFVETGTISRDDLPTTAKMVTVTLGAGSAPVIIKSDPQLIESLPSNKSSHVMIDAKILPDATVGEYQLPLTITYTYLASSEQQASDFVQFNYQTKTEIFPLTIRIKPEMQINVIDSVPENLNVGGTGYLHLTIQNTGSEDGRKATVKLIRNDNSPVIPTDSSVFVGDFPRNGTITCRYKVSVSADAEEQTYPVDVAVTYENSDGDVVTSATDTTGVRVSGKIPFAIVSGAPEVVPGSDGVIIVEYENRGNTTAYYAQSRILAVDPFRSSDDTAYLGDIAPGGKATARYKISTDAGAADKEYSLDSEIRYRDALDNSHVSDTIRAPIRVVPRPASDMLVLPVIALCTLLAIACVAGYYLLVRKKKR